MNRKRILIMAGGTGGHVFPGLALASELQSRGYDIDWLGTEKGIESKLVPESGLPLYTVKIFGIRGRGIKALFLAPFNILSAIFSVLSLLRKVKPSLVVGFGGYTAGPGGVAARVNGLPLIIHEQNAIPGTTNKYLAKIASKVATAFPNVLANGEFIGNPVRKDILNLNKSNEAESGKIKLLIMGGSRGARAINTLVPEAIALLADERLEIVHQSGEADFDQTKTTYEKFEIPATVSAFIDDMPAALSEADVVICRSGASTVTELAVAGLPALFIPFPYAIDDHQTANAKFLENVGAALILQQKKLTAQILAETIKDLCVSKTRLKEMGMKAKAVAISDATTKLANMCEELVNG